MEVVDADGEVLNVCDGVLEGKGDCNGDVETDVSSSLVFVSLARLVVCEMGSSNVLASLGAFSTLGMSSEVNVNSFSSDLGMNKGSHSGSDESSVAETELIGCSEEISYGFGTSICRLAFRRQWRMRKCSIFEPLKKSASGRG